MHFMSCEVGCQIRSCLMPGGCWAAGWMGSRRKVLMCCRRDACLCSTFPLMSPDDAICESRCRLTECTTNESNAPDLPESSKSVSTVINSPFMNDFKSAKFELRLPVPAKIWDIHLTAAPFYLPTACSSCSTSLSLSLVFLQTAVVVSSRSNVREEDTASSLR
jgi:hypothetical protein